MPKFQVCLTQDTTQSVVVVVEAKDIKDAEDQALTLDQKGAFSGKYHIDDNHLSTFIAWITDEHGEDVLP